MFHRVFILSIVLRMTNSFLMPAVRMTFESFPSALSRSANLRMSGLCVFAERAAMYKAVRTVRPEETRTGSVIDFQEEINWTCPRFLCRKLIDSLGRIFMRLPAGAQIKRELMVSV